MKGIAFMGLALVLAGCAPHRTHVPYVPKPYFIGYSPTEIAELPQTGTGVVTGQVFLRTVGGDVKYGAGSRVYLYPATTYTDQFYRAHMGKTPTAVFDMRAKQAGQAMQADGTGSFRFESVPPGAYYLESEVEWFSPSRHGLSRQGGIIMVKTEAENGKTTTIMITE